MERLTALVAKYGVLAFVIHYSVGALVFAGFAIALLMGFEVEGTAAQASIWLAAYAAYKLTMPPRIALTLVLTPLIARWLPARRPPAGVEDGPTTPWHPPPQTPDDTPR